MGKEVDLRILFYGKSWLRCQRQLGKVVFTDGQFDKVYFFQSELVFLYFIIESKYMAGLTFRFEPHVALFLTATTILLLSEYNDNPRTVKMTHSIKVLSRVFSWNRLQVMALNVSSARK